MSNIRKDIAENKYKGILILLIMIEVFTGGGGDFYSFHIGGIRLTARMVLFVLVVMSYIFSKRRWIDMDRVGRSIYLLFVYNTFSCVFGVLLNSPNQAISTWLSVLYLAAYLPIVSHYKDRYASFESLYRTLLVCSTIVASVTLGIYIACNTGMTSVWEMRQLLDAMPGDWWMRQSGGVAYPSQTYVLVAGILILTKSIFSKTRVLEKGLMIFYFVALMSTSTRGLIITMAFSIICVIFIANLKRKLKASSSVFIILAFVIFIYFIQNIDFSRVFSFVDQIGGRRELFLIDGIKKLLSNPIFTVIGCGYGVALKSTGSLNLEISLFEILLEQGIIGVILWLLYVINSITYINNGIKHEQCRDYVGYGLIISMLAIFVESFTNPYLNNTVGILCFLICLLVFKNESYKKEIEVSESE